MVNELKQSDIKPMKRGKIKIKRYKSRENIYVFDHDLQTDGEWMGQRHRSQLFQMASEDV